MDKIIDIRDRDGNTKAEQLAYIIEEYGNLDGEIVHKDFVREEICLCFIYANQDAKMLRTSTIEKIVKEDKKWVVTTRNSVYVFEVSKW